VANNAVMTQAERGRVGAAVAGKTRRRVACCNEIVWIIGSHRVFAHNPRQCVSSVRGAG
jgi:hypothetical protein